MKNHRSKWPLRTRLTLLVVAAVGISLLLTWGLSRWLVLGPLARDIARSQITQLALLKEEIERGVPVEKLSERAGRELILVRGARRRRQVIFNRCETPIVRNRRVRVCRMRDGLAISVRLPGEQQSKPPRAWLFTREPVDPEAAMRGILLIISTIAITIIVLSGWIAAMISRPIRASIEAMNRVAGGELHHRLPENGPSELREVSRAFNHMADRILALLQSERSLMAGISHEIRTPLARLRVGLALLEQHPTERTQSMERDIADIDQMVGEVIESSRLSIGERPLSLDKVHLRLVTEEALSQQPLPDHDVRIEGSSLPVIGDHARLARVVRNLLDNASKYAPKDTLITVQLEAQSISVMDEGPGVPTSDIPHLFEPFYRVAHHRSSGAPGYGLGLMIARQIAELHGGAIEARNRPNGGLAITLSLRAWSSSEDAQAG